MPHFVVSKVQNALNDHSKAVRGSKIHIMGVAYKRDIDDVRESPALDVIHLLQKRGAQVVFSDPYVAEIRIDGSVLTAVPETAVETQTALRLSPIDQGVRLSGAGEEFETLIVDTRNALKGVDSPKIQRL